MKLEQINALIEKGFTPDFIMGLTDDKAPETETPAQEEPEIATQEEPEIETPEQEAVENDNKPNTEEIIKSITKAVYNRVIKDIQKANVLDSVLEPDNSNVDREVDEITASFFR